MRKGIRTVICDDYDNDCANIEERVKNDEHK